MGSSVKWWPWRQHKTAAEPPAEVETSPEQTEDERFFETLNKMFENAEHADYIMRFMLLAFDNHCTQYHQYLNECDIYCVPHSVSAYLRTLSTNEARMLALVAIKHWYTCFVTLRYERNS